MGIDKYKIIIVGGGLAGLGVARKLHDNNEKDFLILTENLGGRVKTSPDGEVNYGAYYITADCETVMPYMDVKRPLRVWDYRIHDEVGHNYSFVSPWILKHVGALLKLVKDLFVFRRHFVAMRIRSRDESRESLIESDSLLKKYYHQLAGDYIKERGLENLTKKYLEQALWGNFFVDPRTVPTFIFMQCLLPIIVPTYSFKLKVNKLVSGFEDKINFCLVTKVDKDSDGFVLRTNDGKICYCKILVLATPMNITNKLISPQEVKGGIGCSYFHVKGELKAPYNLYDYNFFPLNEKTAISRELDGTYLYFYTGQNKIHRYFSNYEIITADSWDPALILLGDEYINTNPEPNLYLANDHNVASTEDAFINGIYIANQILKK